MGAILVNSYIITIYNNQRSVSASERCIKSTKIPVKKFDAITEQHASKLMRDLGITWNYPWEGTENDFASGLTKTAYTTANPLKRVACFLSHYLLWKKCAEQDEPILVLEHDAIFISPLDLEELALSHPDIIGINDPRGATRKSLEYHELIQKNPKKIQPVPTIDDLKIPQGLAGNSAYIIKPTGAKKLLELVKEFGAWPNDALMCKQLIPNMGVTKKYYTKVQGIPSMTSL